MDQLDDYFSYYGNDDQKRAVIIERKYLTDYSNPKKPILKKCLLTKLRTTEMKKNLLNEEDDIPIVKELTFQQLYDISIFLKFGVVNDDIEESLYYLGLYIPETYEASLLHEEFLRRNLYNEDVFKIELYKDLQHLYYGLIELVEEPIMEIIDQKAQSELLFKNATLIPKRDTKMHLSKHNFIFKDTKNCLIAGGCVFAALFEYDIIKGGKSDVDIFMYDISEDDLSSHMHEK